MLIYTAITSLPTLLILFIFVCSAAVMRDKSLHDDGDDNNDHDDNGTWSFLGLLAIDWLICYVNIMITPLRIRLEDTYLDIWSLRSANYVCCMAWLMMFIYKIVVLIFLYSSTMTNDVSFSSSNSPSQGVFASVRIVIQMNMFLYLFGHSGLLLTFVTDNTQGGAGRYEWDSQYLSWFTFLNIPLSSLHRYLKDEKWLTSYAVMFSMSSGLWYFTLIEPLNALSLMRKSSQLSNDIACWLLPISWIFRMCSFSYVYIMSARYLIDIPQLESNPLRWLGILPSTPNSTIDSSSLSSTTVGDWFVLSRYERDKLSIPFIQLINGGITVYLLHFQSVCWEERMLLLLGGWLRLVDVVFLVYTEFRWNIITHVEHPINGSDDFASSLFTPLPPYPYLNVTSDVDSSLGRYVEYTNMNREERNSAFRRQQYEYLSSSDPKILVQWNSANQCHYYYFHPRQHWLQSRLLFDFLRQKRDAREREKAAGSHILNERISC